MRETETRNLLQILKQPLKHKKRYFIVTKKCKYGVFNNALRPKGASELIIASAKARTKARNSKTSFNVTDRNLADFFIRTTNSSVFRWLPPKPQTKGEIRSHSCYRSTSGFGSMRRVKEAISAVVFGSPQTARLAKNAYRVRRTWLFCLHVTIRGSVKTVHSTRSM